jgi:hypothetical protein
MKKYQIFTLALVLLLSACNSEDLGTEATFVHSFSVVGKIDGRDMPFRATINDNNTVTIKVSPYIDAEEALESAVPSFYLSKGATVSPDPTVPQNFAQAGGVKYTVTSEDKKTTREYVVSWGISDQIPYGEGFSFAEIGTAKNFVELGYPGIFEGWNHGVSDAKEYGDLLMYHAYCGDYIVMLSRLYADENPASPYAIRVVDKTNLNNAGSLNLGSISVANLKLISSDSKGQMVGLVVIGSETGVFYWTTPTAAPRSIGKIGINMASTTDGSANFQVSGDITGNAWITAMAPRGARGEHYRVKVTNGQLAATHSIVETGFPSNDCTWFQMISPLNDSDQPSFVIGDTEGAAGQNNTVRAYLNSYAGTTLAAIPGLWQNMLQTWWVGTGATTQRVGGRTPVSALVINGKSYVIVTSGTAWWHSAAVLHTDMETLAHENLNIAHSINRGWSYGSWVDWYWCEDNNEAYLAVWFGRLGLYTYKLTCFE